MRIAVHGYARWCIDMHAGTWTQIMLGVHMPSNGHAIGAAFKAEMRALSHSDQETCEDDLCQCNEDLLFKK